MERINLGYSVKNIPIGNERGYKLQLLESVETLIKKMRWKAIFYNSPYDQNLDKKESYGLKTPYCPPQVKELVPFENDLLELARNVKFRKTTNDFQKRMNADIKTIRNSDKTYTSADKTSNLYKLNVEEYKRLRNNAVTATYKKANPKIKDTVDKNGVKYAKNAGVLHKMEKNTTSNCFITLKDHKQNFNNNPTTRLINPAKNQIGRISKVVLDNINSKLAESLGVNQWKNSDNVIEWFKNIQNKSMYTFTVFDIKDFYPSITETLLEKAIHFARTRTPISSENIEIIHHARKSLLFSENGTWIKKNSGLFDVTMGAFDGAEICELVGTFILNSISERFNKKDIGLYRDDGLSVFKNLSGPENEKVKKILQKIFKENGLNIIIQCNMKIVNYLDLTLNLNDGTYKPYRKEDEDTNYIHKDSDHPPNVIKQLPISIEKRLSKLSSSKEIFDQTKGYYQEALARSGHTHILNYKENTDTAPKNRQRKIIWFNPPYSGIVSTNIGKNFLQLINKHFPPSHKFRKLFNRNNIKISYACRPNIGSIINSHNRKILGENTSLELGQCNCIDKSSCPLDGHCLTRNILYEAEISTDRSNYGPKYYKGITEPEFKLRYGNHKKAFNNRKYINDSELSKEIWKLKANGLNYNVKWRITNQYPTYNQNTMRCYLCQSEKIAILEATNINLLNKRSEIISKCRHQNKYKLAALTSNKALEHIT